TLVHQGIVEETQDGYPVAVLNKQSWEVLRGGRKVLLAEPTRAKRQKKGKKEIPAHSLTPDDALFETLRRLRKQLADESGVPPYVIFHDATLREIAARKPRSPTELSVISGVGQRKLDRYGAQFLAIVRESTSSEADTAEAE
ncbi:MAG TPA: HRDC domain-containing protein, partial [Povalibacter sp.]|uniref:HRDC domain-containing protein n=1 Tax=Povalibacter sp. TaxID=1962978 RepID=UPI002C7483AE